VSSRAQSRAFLREWSRFNRAQEQGEADLPQAGICFQLSRLNLCLSVFICGQEFLFALGASVANMRIAILTVSDSVSSGKAEDRSGPAVARRCQELGWEILSSTILPDDQKSIHAFLKETADAQGADVILTTGGTGFGPRDVTPEATLAVAERLAPGFAEHMRAEGQKKTKWAILSRGVTVIRGNSIIVNLPGSPKGAVESLDAIAEFLPHAIAVLHGARHD
jgi:molybdopterin adenylyltransferase